MSNRERKGAVALTCAAVLALLLPLMGLPSLQARAQQHKAPAAKPAYPAPRWPAYLRAPRSVEDAMPRARVLARDKAGFGGNSPGIGLGMLRRGDEVMIVTDTTADGLIVEAVRRALAERGVKSDFVPNYTLAGVSKADAETIRQKTEIRSAQEGFMEAKYYWIERVFAHPEAPKEWLKKRRPDLYAALYPKRDEMSPQLYQEWKKLSNENVGAAVRDYLMKHPKVKGVYWGHPGGAFYARTMAPLEAKYLGRCSFTNRWEVMSDVPAFPSDVFRLVEKKTLAPIADIDEVHVTDPEGTDISWKVPEEMAQRWAKGAYWRGHLLMYPDSATGQYPYDFDRYPAHGKQWIPRSPTAQATGVIAGTNGSGGFWPRMEVRLKNGYITQVTGGGLYGDVIREFLNYPHINDVTYPYYDRPGFWHLWEVALGTNPKYFRNPTDFYGGGTAGIYCLTYERYRSGVFHWGLGNEIASDPGSRGTPVKWDKFAADRNLPSGHDFHIQNYFITYRAHLRSTGKWVTLVDRGHLTALDDPEVRALASKHGDPDRILSEDWIPEVPGINAPGSYAEYAKDPWKYADAQMKKILNGSYQHDYPPVKGRR
ncbi:MAG TPA: hypothetical protein VGW33_02285 [Terriglobia bacterium]|nr:hypothetical protein [Terriglobia bacterium]